MKKLLTILSLIICSAATMPLARANQNTEPDWINQISGFTVWSSNRAGNHDIWMLELPSMQAKQLTTHPHTENFARISPDGSKIAFARSHQPHQSLRDKRPWDIWILDLKTGEETLIAKWGLAPSWSNDSKTLVFQRSPDKIIAYDLGNKQESIIYQSGQDNVVQQAVDLNTPSIGFGDQMAFTFRNHGQPTNVIRDQNGIFSVVHRDACQVMWSPSGKFVTYVQKGGKQINQIMHYDPNTAEKTTLVDLPGEFSHEYFPRLTQDEKYMIFAASAGGHEHDLADYELFLWPVGSDMNSTVRLTHHQGNDSWPDIWLTHRNTP